MNLEQLAHFVLIGDLGSVSKAAEIAGIAQSALSRQIRQLELELHQSLLYRNGRGVSLTQPGERLMVHAKKVLAQIEEIREDLSDNQGSPQGHIIVGLPPTLATFIAVPFVREFAARFPAAELRIVEALSLNLNESIVSGQIDIAVLFNPLPSPQIELRPLTVQPMFLTSVRKGADDDTAAPVRLRELPAFPLIAPSRSYANRMRIETELAAVGLKPTVTLEVDGIGSILDLVFEGYGHAVLPINSMRGHRHAADFMLRPIVEPTLTISIFLATSARRLGSRLMRETLRLANDILPTLLTEPLAASRR